MQIEATYSAEDNKLRLYPSARLDKDLYDRVKAEGFRWAPRQELFVAPKWTTKREDLCLELAGDIMPEQSTMIERAEMRAGRFEGYAEARADDASAFANAARDISERFAGGQPILVGHHSERKARKDAERAENAMQKAVKAAKTVSYWNYRAAGTVHHAERKNRADVRARRIKTLLTELRDMQRRINHCFKVMDRITKCRQGGLLEKLAFGAWSSDGGATDEQREQIKDGSLSLDDWAGIRFAAFESSAQSDFYARWISHILNRLAYERSLLGNVQRFSGDLTPAIIQTFARTMGADKPKAVKSDYGWILTSPVPLPLHLGNGHELELDDNGTRDLMRSCGYQVPDAKPKKPPILNLPVDVEIESLCRYHGTLEAWQRVELTKAEYKKADGYIRLSKCGLYRFRTCPDPTWSGPYYQAPRVAAFLTDSKAHNLPALEVAQ